MSAIQGIDEDAEARRGRRRKMERSMIRKRWTARAALIGGVLGAAAFGSCVPASDVMGAEPLAADVCEALQNEQRALASDGVPEAMAKGPDWVRANGGGASVKKVARYIAVQEQLMFQCGHAKLRAQSEAEAAAASDTTVAPPPPLPKRKPAQRPKATAAAKEKPSRPATRRAGEDAGRAKAKAKPAARAKPKVDDAYRPPVKGAEAPRR
jgi:hypothetical protein